MRGRDSQPNAPTPWPADLGANVINEVEPGTVLFRQDQAVKTIYLIESGLVRIHSQDRQVDVPMAVRSVGWALGAVPAIRNRRHIATGTATNRCIVRCLDVAEFHRRRRETAVGLWVQGLLAWEAEDQFFRSRMLMGSDLRARLDYVIVDLLRSAGDTGADGSLRLKLPLTVVALSEFVSAKRESLSRLLMTLKREGTLVKRNGWFVAPKGSRYIRIVQRD